MFISFTFSAHVEDNNCSMLVKLPADILEFPKSIALDVDYNKINPHG